MEQLIKQIAKDSNWSKWVAANSAQGSGKDGCISRKTGCIS